MNKGVYAVIWMGVASLLISGVGLVVKDIPIIIVGVAGVMLALCTLWHYRK
jgi:hypothetical protein